MLLGAVVPSGARFACVAALGAFVTASGAARTAALQAVRDRTSAYPAQGGAMSQIVATAPELKPGTLLVIMDGMPTWVGTFVFHHAVDVIYGRHVAGCVTNPRETVFYTCPLEADGIRHEPWRMLQSPWDARPHTYRFDEIVIFRSDSRGRVALVDEWPAQLPALPAGATYAPRARITSSAPPPPSRAILARLH